MSSGSRLRILTHRQDAEDVTQETFLRVFRSMRRWDPKRPLATLDSRHRREPLSDLAGGDE